MATFQTLQQGLTDSRHLGTQLFRPYQWLKREVRPITDPMNKDKLFKDVAEKIARTVFRILIPFALIFTAVGYAYNFAAHFLNPLGPELPPARRDSSLPLSSASVHQVAEDRPPSPSPAPAASPAQPSENIYQELMTQVQELHDEFDRIFQEEGLPGLRGEKKDQLLGRFQELEVKITPHQDRIEMISVNQVFFPTRNQFLAAIQKRCELIQAPLRIKDNRVIPIPDKGNCFYIAASAAYELYASENTSMEDSDLRLDPKQLRTDIVNWQRQNIERDNELEGLIAAGISIYVMDMEQKIDGLEASIETFEALGEDTTVLEHEIEQLKQQIQLYQPEETRFTHYFAEVSNEGFWGGVAEFYAFSKMYNVAILVREKNMFGEKPENECFRFNVGAPKQMIIWWIDGHHFELRMD